MKPITIEQIKKDLETAAYVERLMPPVRTSKISVLYAGRCLYSARDCVHGPPSSSTAANIGTNCHLGKGNFTMVAYS